MILDIEDDVTPVEVEVVAPEPTAEIVVCTNVRRLAEFIEGKAGAL